MKESIPSPARLFFVAICALGSLAGLLVSLVHPPGAVAAPWEMAIFLGLALLLGGQSIAISRDEKNEAATISIGFALTFAAIVRFGPSFGVLIGALCAISSSVYPTRLKLPQLCFKVGLAALESSLGGLAFAALNGWSMALLPYDTFMAITGSVLIIYLVNSSAISVFSALCSGESPALVWRKVLVWKAPNYFLGGTLGSLTIILFKENTGLTVLFVSPVAYLVYLSYTGYTARALEKETHIKELQNNQAHLAELYLATIKSLALAIDAKDQYTHQHILRVQTYSVAIARQMGLEGTLLEAVNTGALLHDIGKLGVPEYVLLKPGRLTPEEFEKIKKHPEIGAAILDPVEFPWPVLPVVRHHHEKWDGTGYPDGLKGEQIPLTARIMAVADVYDALTSTRSYRKGWSHEKAKETIINDAGTHFDPMVVEAFGLVIDRVVMLMAECGEGPLAAQSNQPADNKAALAAREISRASSELWALYEVAQSLSTSLGVQETINILVHKLEAIFPDACSAFTILEPSGVLRVRGAAGINREYLLGAYTFKPNTASTAVAESKVPYMGEFDAEDLMLQSVDHIAWQPLQASIIVPIVHEGKVLGTINLYHHQDDAFSVHDRDLLEMIAERSALALYNGMLYERTRGSSDTDSLTGLYNIRHFIECIEERCEESSLEGAIAEPFALFCLDLDCFKPINDNFGHEKGDEVLREVAHILAASAPQRSLLCRYGGDEFLVLVECVDSEMAGRLAENMLLVIKNYDPNLVHYKLGDLRVNASIGYACFPADGYDCASLLSAADAAMCRQKSEHKLGGLAASTRIGRAA